MQKNKWWADRKKAAELAAAGTSGKALPSVPIPVWKAGHSVSLESLKAVTDAYVKALEPKRKLVDAEKSVVEEGGKLVEGFKFISKAEAAKVIAARRAQVRERL